MKPAFNKLALALILGSFASGALAAEVCMPAHEMRASLIDWYGERPVPGQDQGNTQLWVSEATGTWTIVKSLSDGNACVTAQGENWMAGLDQQRIMASLEPAETVDQAGFR